MSLHLDRRTVLRLLAALAGTTLLPDRTRAGSQRRYPVPQTHPVAPFFSDLSAVVSVGTTYLGAHGDEADGNRLAEWVGLPPRVTAATLDVPTWRAAFTTRQRDDFRARRFFEMDGWLLTRTEARLCALVYLETSLPGHVIVPAPPTPSRRAASNP